MTEPSSGILRRAELNEVKGCLGFVLAGEYEESVGGDQTAAERAHSILSSVPVGGAMVAFTHKQLALLYDAITNGAEGILQRSSGYRPDERREFKKAANRIIEAGKLNLPGF